MGGGSREVLVQRSEHVERDQEAGRVAVSTYSEHRYERMPQTALCRYGARARPISVAGQNMGCASSKPKLDDLADPR